MEVYSVSRLKDWIFNIRMITFPLPTPIKRLHFNSGSTKPLKLTFQFCLHFLIHWKLLVNRNMFSIQIAPTFQNILIIYFPDCKVYFSAQLNSTKYPGWLTLVIVAAGQPSPVTAHWPNLSADLAERIQHKDSNDIKKQRNQNYFKKQGQKLF